MISAFVITFNSEKYLRRCLESLSFADEIIVVDSGSTDRTKEIAIDSGAKVIEKEFCGFSDKKEFAKNLCSYDWVVNIDADEYIPYETADEIKNAIKNERYDAYIIPFRTYFQEREIKFGRHRNEFHIRLMKKRLNYGNESVHEKIINSSYTGTLKNYIIHTPYNSKEDIKTRAYRNAELASQDKAHLNILLLIIFMIFNPLFRFIKEYFIQFGLLDKSIGLYLAYYSSKEVFLKYFWGIKRKFSLFRPH
ncbi:MAG: glycosyltransferase family 2 protein [Deltaproteobacteria bacterium]|nr:glycosyltransferase family 2 protein [Deltaproteobacteria bacterium]